MVDPKASTDKLKAAAVWVAVAALVCAITASMFWRRGDSTGQPVEGSVTLDGAPVNQAVIQFVPIPPTVAKKLGSEIVGGKYRLDGVNGLPNGRYRVEFEMVPPDAPSPGAGMAAMRRGAIPEMYRTLSSLEVEVGESACRFDFDLSSRQPEANKVTVH